MNSYNTCKNINDNSINSFNPSYISKLMNYRRNNGNPSKINKDISLLFHNNRNARALRPQKIKLNNDINRKILENIDSTNDIRIKNNNYFSSLSSNSTSYNYYTKRRSQLYKNAYNLDSSVSQSRNVNKNNGNSLSKTTWSSFSIRETSHNNNNNNNKLTNGYEYKYNNMTANKKNSRIKNLKNRNNYYNGYRAYNYNEYNYDKLKENGIEYCIDKDGNPMTVSEIKTKNKYPIAYIMQKNGNNILLDLDNRIINPNQNGDYILPQRPYFIIRKYDVQYPELRVINYDNSNTEYYKINNNNSDYISINVNDSNEKLYNKNNNNKKNEEKKNFRKNQKCNLYNFSNFGEERNNFFIKIDNNHKNIQNKTSNFNSRKNLAINNDYSKSAKLNHSNLRDKKRKYIFVNKLANENKNIQLKINIDNNDNNKENINDNNNDNNSYFCTQLNSLNNTCKNKETDNKNLYSENNSSHNNTNKKDEKNEKNYLSEKRNNFKLFIKKLTGFKSRMNKLKDIKCFTHKEIKNLEFKFERKYKNKNITSFIRPSFMPSDLKIDTINETPKGKSKEKEEEKNNKDSEKNEKFEKIDIKNTKKQKYSELMYSNNAEKQNNFSTPNNMLTTLSTLNHSFLSPPSEATAYTTIQNLHRELEKNKRFPVTQTQGANGINIKKINSFKYYLKPRLNSQKAFHKRKNPDEINKIDKKKFSLFKLVNENEKNNTINGFSLNEFYTTALDFNIKNCQHNTDNNNNYNQNTEKIESNIMNNSVCKCPYCHHLFYN